MMVKSLVACIDPRSRGAVMGVWTTGQQLGGAIANVAIGTVLVSLGWPSAFVLPSLVTAGAGVALWRLMPETTPTTPPLLPDHDGVKPGTGV